jgi:hypothetical protein
MKKTPNRLSTRRALSFCLAILSVSILSSFASESTAADAELTEEDVKSITREAYIYAYPMMEHYKMIYVLKVWEDSPVYETPFNELTHNAVLLGPEYTVMVRPNNDTFYSNVMFDLRAEPMILSVPAISDNRYYSWQLIDLFTHNVDYVGTRATGSQAGKYLIAGPDWSGKKPEGVTKVIQTDSNILLALARTQVYSADDAENAQNIMNKYKVETLSQHMGTSTSKVAAQLDFPVYSLEAIRSVDFITYLNFALGLVKPNPSEKALLDRFSKIGIGANVPFDVISIDAETKKIMQEAVDEAMVEIEAETKNLGTVVDGWMQVSGAFGSPKEMEGKYLTRAAAAYFGLYGNDLEEAFYPDTTIDENGNALDGSKHNYVLHFAKDRLPPVKAFWSLSMYKMPEQLFTENEISRYVISSATDGLEYNQDGSLDIYIQKDKPSADKVSNWLPAYDGEFSLQARLYWPEPESLSPLYILPKVTIAK